MNLPLSTVITISSAKLLTINAVMMGKILAAKFGLNRTP